MKEFRTTLKVTPAKVLMELNHRILTQGSCFSDAIGDRLAQNKLKTAVNPFGTIYNPESIHKAMLLSIADEPLPAHTYVLNGDLHLNFDFHSGFSSLRKEVLVSRLQTCMASTHTFLKDTEWILFTYGTAWVYRRNDTGEVVANCHKLPSSMFSKSIMSVESIVSSFDAFYGKLRAFNPNARIILTVSPVRHIRDTLELNSVSKSALRLACQHIADRHDDVEYFPAYEIMLDDLRDYRFYATDMLHPTVDAEVYIWEKFMERYFSAGLQEFVRAWRPILAALAHKAFHPQSQAHQQFIKETLRKLSQVETLVDVQAEKEILRRQLIN